MPAKRHLKKTTSHKKLIRALPTINNVGYALDRSSPKGKEAAIVRQFHQIQKNYTRLMTDVAKELVLVKSWIGSQAATKRNDLKARLNARLSRN